MALLLVFVSTAANIAWAQGASAIESQKALVTEFEVNGLKVVVKKRVNAKTVSGGLFIRGGVRNINSENAGIEGLALLSATEGSKSYPRDELRRELAESGSRLGAGVTNDYGVLNFATTSAAFDKTWNVFSDVVLNPTFNAADVERVRDLILTGLRNREDDADNYLDSLQEKIIYAKHPYANDVNGTIATVSSFKPEDLKKYHSGLFQTSRLLLVIVGNVDIKAVKNNVQKTFGKLPIGNYKEERFPSFDFSKPTLDIASRRLPTNYIKGVFNAPSIGEKDYYAMRVAVTILRNRLFEEVRQKRSLSYAPSASMDSFTVNTGNIYVTAVDANRTVNIMMGEIKRLRSELVNPRMIQSVAGGFLTSYFLEKETNAAQAVSLAQFELTGGGWENSFEFLKKIRAVQPADVRSVSLKYMKNLRFVVVGNPFAIEKSIFLQDLEKIEN